MIAPAQSAAEKRPLADLRPYCWALGETFNARKIWVGMETHVAREWAEALFEKRQCFVIANAALRQKLESVANQHLADGYAWARWEAACARTLHQLRALIETGKLIQYRYY